MEQPTQEPPLGSINQFATEYGADPKDPEVFTLYTQRLQERRREVAQSLGLTVAELHSSMPTQAPESEAA